MSEPQFDLVVFGATSFVGQILTRRLVERIGVDGDVRWAIAGRNADKLREVAADTGADVEQIVADAADADCHARAGGLDTGRRIDRRARTRSTGRRWLLPSPKPAPTTATSPVSRSGCGR